MSSNMKWLIGVCISVAVVIIPAAINLLMSFATLTTQVADLQKRLDRMESIFFIDELPGD